MRPAWVLACLAVLRVAAQPAFPCKFSSVANKSANSICPSYGMPCGNAPGQFICARGTFCRAQLLGAGGTYSGVCDTQPMLPAVRARAVVAAVGRRRRWRRWRAGVPCLCAQRAPPLRSLISPTRYPLSLPPAFCCSLFRAGVRPSVHARQRCARLRVRGPAGSGADGPAECFALRARLSYGRRGHVPAAAGKGQRRVQPQRRVRVGPLLDGAGPMPGAR